ncbi:HNH endonuclease family protein [Clostridium perfringens]
MDYKRPTLEKEDIDKIIHYMKREPRSQNYTIGSINELYKDGDLILNPEYQRNYIQSDKEASKFVESVFLGCVIPEVQLYQDENTSVIEVLDGQQRITSLIRFMDGKYALSGLTDLKMLNGFYYSDLPKELKKKFKNYVLVSRIVKEEDDEYKFFVFGRLNTGSKKLNAQEIRNCIFMGEMLNKAKEISNTSCVKSLFEKAGLSDVRFSRTEFVLRTLSISLDFPVIKGVASQQINKLLIESKSFSKDKIDELGVKYIQTIKLINEYIGDECLRNSKNELTKVNLEAIFVNLFKFFDKREIIANSELVQTVIMEVIIENEEYISLNDKATDNRNGIIGRILILRDKLDEVLCHEKLDKDRVFSFNDKIKLWYSGGKRKRKCPICQNEIIDFDLCEVDHIIPWSKGGQTVLENAQLVHSTCNKYKQDRINFTIKGE